MIKKDKLRIFSQIAFFIIVTNCKGYFSSALSRKVCNLYSSQHLKHKTKMRSCLRTTLMNFFDPLQMLTIVYFLARWLQYHSDLVCSVKCKSQLIYNIPSHFNSFLRRKCYSITGLNRNANKEFLVYLFYLFISFGNYLFWFIDNVQYRSYSFGVLSNCKSHINIKSWGGNVRE